MRKRTCSFEDVTMLKHVETSAPGKVILLGEHAVVYGKTALACTIERRIKCAVRNSDVPRVVSIRVDSQDMDGTISQTFDRSLIDNFAGFVEDVRYPVLMDSEELASLQNAISPFASSGLELKLFEICLIFYLGIASSSLQDSDTGLILDISSELSFGAGLGSSASLCVSLAGAFLMFCQVIKPHLLSDGDASNGSFSKHDLNLINKWAFQGEKIAHGKPSGIDNSVVTYGGVISYCNGAIEWFEEFPQMEIILVNTKVRRSTNDMVTKLREKHEKLPRVYDAIFNAIESLVEEWKALLAQRNFAAETRKDYEDLLDKFIEMTDLNHGLLRTLGVSHDAIETVLGILRRFGFKGKLTGAGGGGSVFTLIKPGVKEAALNGALDAIRDSEFDCWRVSIGGDGIKCNIYMPIENPSQ